MAGSAPRLARRRDTPSGRLRGCCVRHPSGGLLETDSAAARHTPPRERTHIPQRPAGRLELTRRGLRALSIR